MLVIGHRGASAAAPENSVEAFALAETMGADAVELDVRLAPDGRVLVKHDALPGAGPTLDALPDLGTILAACGGMLVNVEIKNSTDEPGHDPTLAVVAPTLAELRRHGPDKRWLISSFDWATIQRCRDVAPDIMTAYLVVEPDEAAIERTAAAGHRAVHPWEPAVTADVVEHCHRLGLAVTTWTCNDADRIAELAELGVDGVCTDVPDVALAVLGRIAGATTQPTARWGRPA